MTFAETLSEKARRRGRFLAYASAGCGCISEVMMDSSAVVIIYISLLNGSDSMAMFTTSIGVCTMILLIPCAALILRIGFLNAVRIACCTGCFGYLLMAAAPFFGPGAAKYVALSGSFLYALQRPLYGATWYPLLDNFLRPQDRGDFFGTMRCIYMLLSCAFFFIIGVLMKQNSSVPLLQIVLALTGLLIIGRCYFIFRFPLNPEAKTEKMDLRKALGISLTNGPLAGYSVYAALFSLAYTSIFPLILIYLKSHVQLSDGNVQLISTIGIAGSISGFFFYGTLLKRFGLKTMELTVHILMMLMVFTLFFYGKSMPGFLGSICVISFFVMFCQSCFICNNSAEMMALARPGNKLIATAFCQTYGSLGAAVGRSASSLLIGSTLLTSLWHTDSGCEYSRFQTLFLFCGCFFVLLFMLIPLMPSVIPKHHDYYEPGVKQ